MVSSDSAIISTPGNSLRPLPPDYYDLTQEGQRKARIAAVGEGKVPEDGVWSWAFFRHYYLEYLEEGAWYSPPRLPSPPFHYRFIQDVYEHNRNVQCFPRGAAKSSLKRELCLQWAVSRPHHSILLVNSTEDLIHSDFTDIRIQLTSNSRIIDDFGKLQPRKGEGQWSNSRIRLTNGFRMIGRSVMGSLPGLRPRFIFCDDCELDKKMRVKQSELTENFRRMLEHHLLPMLRKGTGIMVTTTLYTRKIYAYYLATAREEDDPQVGVWNRVIYAAKLDNGTLLWPEMWGEEDLTRLRLELGEESFQANLMNRPGSLEDRTLQLREPEGFYTVKGDVNYRSNPLSSSAVLTCYRRKSEELVEVSRDFGKSVSRMFRFIVVDPNRNPGRHTDFAFVTAVGVERTDQFRDVWWVLDARMGRIREPELIDWVWEMGIRWKVRMVAVESAGFQKSLVERTQTEFHERAVWEGWTPRIFPVKYLGGHTDKCARIAALGWRFSSNRILLPYHLIHLHPYMDLRFQIDNFINRGGDDTNLPFDDALDTLAMIPFCIRPGQASPDLDERPEESPLDLLGKGQYRFPGTDIPTVAFLDLRKITPEDLGKLTKVLWKQDEAVKGRKKRRMRV